MNSKNINILILVVLLFNCNFGLKKYNCPLVNGKISLHLDPIGKPDGWFQIDSNNEGNNKVHTVSAGKVLAIGPFNNIVIRKDSLVYEYKFLDTLFVKKGQNIEYGEVIGLGDNFFFRIRNTINKENYINILDIYCGNYLSK